jgi:DNA-binding NarL/FixJ family response regulator
LLKILVADDHDVVRAGIRALIEARAEWHVVAEAGDGPTAIDQAFATKPDVAIIDYSLPIINGGDVTRQIRSKLPGTEVLIFTMHDSDAVVRDILGAGAKGYVSKSDAQRYLEMAVESLAMHRPFFTPRFRKRCLMRLEAAVRVCLRRARKPWFGLSRKATPASKFRNSCTLATRRFRRTVRQLCASSTCLIPRPWSDMRCATSSSSHRISFPPCRYP